MDGLFNDRDGFDLAEDAFGQLFHCDAAASRFGDEELGIDLVESGKIAHLCQEAGRLVDLFKARTGSFQQCADILAALFSLRSDALGDVAGGRINRDLSGGRKNTIYDVALGIRTNRSGGFVCMHDFHV